LVHTTQAGGAGVPARLLHTTQAGGAGVPSHLFHTTQAGGAGVPSHLFHTTQAGGAGVPAHLLHTTPTQAADILITGAHVIDPASKLNKHADIAIRHCTIAAIGKKLPRTPGVHVIDATGCYATPGLIDPHVHLREPGNERAETIATGTLAGVAGGFTTLCCMPNTTPCLDNDVMMRSVLDRARQTGACRVYPVGAATRGRKGEQLAEIQLMHRAGACAFSDDGDCISSAAIMQRVLATVATTGKAFMQHCQDHQLSNAGVMHAGTLSTKLGLAGWPRAAEEIVIDRDLRLNASINCRYHVQHLSSGGSIPILRAARKAALPVTAEATPHHLLLTCDNIDTSGYDTRYKMNPPLREQSDIDAIKHAIADGTITVLATDHAPHTHESKLLPFDAATFGIVGLETALALYIQALIADGVVNWPRLIDMLTLQPARLCNLDHLGLGQLTVGGPADVTIIDPNEQWTITDDDLVGQSKNTPFLGRKVVGRAITTIVAGQIKMNRRPLVPA
ncbi:MAG: dihydroorotase, partial [bacterium]